MSDEGPNNKVVVVEDDATILELLADELRDNGFQPLALRRGGQVGLITTGEPAPRTLPPRSGEGALHAVRSVLAGGVAADGFADPAALAATLQRVARLAAHSRSLVIVVSDFRDAHGLRAPIAALAARHAVIAIEVVDPRETELPRVGHLAVVDPETGQTVHVNTSSRELRERFAGHEREWRERLRQDLRRAGAGHLVLRTDRDWLRELGRALNA